MLTVAKASWSAGTQTAVVSPLGAYASVIAARVRRDHCFEVVAFMLGSSKLWGGMVTTLGPIVVLEHERQGHLNS